MENPVQLAARLLDALDELIEQEGMYLRGGYYDLAVEIRVRAEPLIRQLVSIAGEPGVSDFRPQVAAVIERSDQHDAFLQRKLEDLRAEMKRTEHARRRSAQIAPAYAHSSTTATPRFQAAG